MITECDRQHEKIIEVQDDVTKKMDVLAKLLEEAAKDRMELTRQHYEEIERAEMALDKV
mgnify:CR=1 FL=1